MSLKLQGQVNSSRSVKQLFLINMQLFDYDPRDNNRRSEENSKECRKHLVSLILRLFESGEGSGDVGILLTSCLGRTFQR